MYIRRPHLPPGKPRSKCESFSWGLFFFVFFPFTMYSGGYPLAAPAYGGYTQYAAPAAGPLPAGGAVYAAPAYAAPTSFSATHAGYHGYAGAPAYGVHPQPTIAHHGHYDANRSFFHPMNLHSTLSAASTGVPAFYKH
uniref:Uncharacterized protein n=1 Tax=Eutreptiella gymnastica TaxID=73025 RepID=A0A6U8MLS6_9EUGL|mmetsp:Transcript_84827/g.148577  ORF Transcript_84827/g.148577 Transcript_84827/m.148577 type:complete len:138 (+) Transcript_84827:157-570(+)